MSIGSKGLTEREAEEEEEAVVEKEGSGREAEVEPKNRCNGGWRRASGKRRKKWTSSNSKRAIRVEDRREDPRGGRCETEAEGAAGEGIPRCEYGRVLKECTQTTGQTKTRKE